MQNRRPNERSKTRPKTALQIPETSIYWQIVIRKTAKKGSKLTSKMVGKSMVKNTSEAKGHKNSFKQGGH
jgi:hypothetical protein